MGRSAKTARRRARAQQALRGDIVKASRLPADPRTGGPSGGVPATRPFALYDAIATATGMPQNLEQMSMPFARDPRDENAFGPGKPIEPAPLDAPDPTTGQPNPRVWQYPTSWNLPGNGQREVPWQVLRTASTAVDIIRRCIRYRQRTLRGLKWRWTVTAEAVQEAYESNPDVGREDAEKTLRAQYAGVIKELTQFWRKPWSQNGLKFGQWANALMEEHLVLDAVAIYPRRALDGTVLDFQILDGATIKPLLDVQGATPSPPYPAYQQELYGFPRGEYGQSYVDEEITQPDGSTAIQRTILHPGMTVAQLFYHRENVRANSPYGLSSVEQALVAARLYLKRQGWMLAEYEDGSTPVTWIMPPVDEATRTGREFTPPIRRAWEDGLNDELGGQTRRRLRGKVLPPGWQALQTQSVDERYKPDYDLHLIKLLCGFFDVPITELGFSEAKGIGNSGLHEGMADVAGKVGDKPDVEVIAEIITDLARTYQGCPEEVELQFVDPKADDSLEQDQSDDLQFKGAQKTLNDVRRGKGLPAYSFAEADMPVLVGVGPTGVVFLEGLYEQQQADRQAALAVQQSTMEAGLVQDDGTPAGDQTAPAEPDGPASGGEDTTKAVAAELIAYSRWRRRNPEPHRPFRFKAATPDDIAVTEHDPDLMEFAGYRWECEYADVDKGAGWDANVKRFRGPNGRFVKGSMAGDVLDALEDAGHAVVRHPDRPRTSKLSKLHEDHLDDVVRRLHAGKKVIRGESSQTDVLERRGLLEEMPEGKGRLGLSDAGRAHLVARAPQDYAELSAPPVLEPTPSIEDARGQGLSDRIRQAETMYGADRSAWPARAKRDLARLEIAERKRSRSGANAEHRDLTPEAPTSPSRDVPRGIVGGMTTSQSEFDQADVRLTVSQERWILGSGSDGSIGGGKTVNEALRRKGLVEIVGGNSGNPAYRLTESGLAQREALRAAAAMPVVEPERPDDLEERMRRATAAQFADQARAKIGELERDLEGIDDPKRRKVREDSLARERAELARQEAIAGQPQTAVSHEDALRSMATREEARQYLASVKGKELDALARSMNITGSTVAEKRERIVDHAVGYRLDSQAIRGWRGLSNVRAAEAETVVRTSVARHANNSGWAGVADVRDDLAAAGYTREEQDSALRALMGQPDVRLIPVADRKNLKPRDRDAALVVGRDDLTAIQIGGERHVDATPTTLTPDELRADLAAQERALELDVAAGAPEDALAARRGAIEELRRQVEASAPSGQDASLYEAMSGYGITEMQRLEELRRISGNDPNRAALLTERAALQRRRDAALAASRELTVRHGSPVERILRDLQGTMDEIERDRQPDTVPQDAPGVESAIGQTFADRVRQAEIMYGTDRSRWPKRVQRDMARAQRREGAVPVPRTVSRSGRPTVGGDHIDSVIDTVQQYEDGLSARDYLEDFTTPEQRVQLAQRLGIEDPEGRDDGELIQQIMNETRQSYKVEPEDHEAADAKRAAQRAAQRAAGRARRARDAQNARDLGKA